MTIALLAASIVANAVLLLRLRHYRRRAKRMQQLSRELAGIGPLDIPLLRLGELVPEVGNDRDPAAQAVDLVLPYAGWGNTLGFSDTEYATLARLAKLGGAMQLHGPIEGPLLGMLAKNAPAGTPMTQSESLGAAPGLILLPIAGSPESLLAASRRALAAIAPGGLVLWHGYRPGITIPPLLDALAELARSTALAHLHGTSLLGHRAAPAEAD